MKIYNSLTRKIEDFEPINPPKVGMYTCGPTVYSEATIGNFRTYMAADLLLRALKFNGFQVDYIMNITDVGHLTGDNLGDADTGEDRMEKSAKEQHKSAWDIAKSYTDIFLRDFEKLNLVKPRLFTKATDHIQEQIDLVKKIEEKGFTYKTSDGIYFDTKKYEEETGKKYGELSDLDQIKEGARVEVNKEKKNERDFALWKFSEKPGERQMEWDSPWGLGFPGWHIECSAMSMKYLGEGFDIHVGGEDLKQTHHPNEIAQAESVTGKQFVKYWVHGTFLKVDGKRMGKSLGNVYTVSDLEEKGYSPIALRYFFLGAKYRDSLNFTFEALKSASNTLNNLRSIVIDLKRSKEAERTKLSQEKLEKVDDYNERFAEAVNNDLNTPQALAVMWEAVKSNIPSPDKLDLLYNFDEVLGLKLREVEVAEIPEEIIRLIKERDEAREKNNYEEADRIRKEIEKEGKYAVLDTPAGTQVKIK